MSSTPFTPLTPLSFILTYISNNKYLSNSKLDITLKATISNNAFPIFKPYLNMLRIIYFLNRLNKKNPREASKYKSKFTIYLNYYNFFTNYSFTRTYYFACY